MARSLTVFFTTLMFLIHSHSYGQTEFILKEQATRLSKSCFTVTLDQTNKAGAIWWPNQIDLNKSIELNFVIYLGNKDGSGADGLSFVMHNDSRIFDAKGEVGGGLFFGDHPSQSAGTKISPSVAIELDTYKNAGGNNDCAKAKSGSDDPSFDHTTVVYNGDICFPEFTPVRLVSGEDNAEDNSCYSAKIVWTPGAGGGKDELSLYIEGQLRFTHKDYMRTNILKTNMVYYGFTGSTGGYSNDQTICIFEGNSTPVAKDDIISTPYGSSLDVDVQANDKDSDGDVIYTTEILVGPKNGTATILNKNQVRYIPNAGYAGLDSLEYRICDIDPEITNGEKCYANCSNAWVYLKKVECPDFILKLSKLSENYKCVDALPDNGGAEAYMLDGTTKITNGVTFKWYKGSYNTLDQVKDSIPYHIGTTVTGMADGVYTVFSEYSGCNFPPSRITINRNQDKPDFKVVLNKSLTTCSPANGEVEVVFNDPSKVVTDYSYKWYEGKGTTPVANTRVFSKAQAKTYKVVVTHKISGCYKEDSIVVPNAYVSPAISYSSSPRTSCSSLDGKLVANVAGDTTSYQFYWAKRTDKNFINPHKWALYNKLDTGLYYLTATDKSTGCPLKDTLNVKVEDQRVSPEVEYSKISQTSCDVTKPNGSITITSVDTGQPLGNYNFSWYKGANTIQSNSLPATKVAAHKAFKLDSGTYTVKVVNNVTGCFTTKTIKVITETDNPVVQLVSLTHLTKCDPADGAISVQVDPDGPTGPKNSTTSNYTFKWWKGESISGGYFKTGASVSGLQAGKYTVLATSKDSCKAQMTFTLNPPTSLPDITNMTVTNDNSCDPTMPNGKIVATVTGGSGNYKYEWFAGSGTTSTPLTETTNTISNLSNNTYTLKITDLGTGCTDVDYKTVGKSAGPVVTVNFPIPDKITCNNKNGDSNGKVNADVGGNTTDYVFYWYEGDQVKDTPDFTGAEWDNLTKGYYTVVAEDKTSHCKSEAKTQYLDEDVYTVTVSINGTVSGCVPTTAVLEAVPATSGTYKYSWYKGVPDLPSYPYFSYSSISSSSSITGISANKYTVMVENSQGCISFGTTDLSNNGTTPEVYLKPLVHNTNCAPKAPNGQFEIDYFIDNGVRVDPDPVTKEFPLNYQIYWVNGIVEPTPLPSSSHNAVYSGLAAGSYGVIVQKDGQACPSSFYQAIIKDVPNTPNVTVSVIHKTNCWTGTQANGSISVKVNNFSGNQNDYLINWGNASTLAPIFTAANATWTLSGVDQGTYTIEVRDLNSTCSTSRTVTISPNHTPPTADVTVVANTSCDGNGSITLVSPNTALYKYYWYNEDGTYAGDPTPDGTETSITGKMNGSYYLNVIDKATNCSTRIDRDIDDERIYPTVTVESSTYQTSCNPPYDGTATIALNTGSNYNDPAQYTYKWELDGSIVSPVLVNTDNNGNLLPANQFRATGLASGSYTLTVTNSTNCATVVTFDINDVFDLPYVTASATDKTECPSDGSATANSTVPAGLTSFNWYSVINGEKSTSPIAINTPSITNQAPGEYAVEVIGNNGCVSPLFQVEIKDQTPKISISLLELINYSTCDPTKPNGRLRVEEESGYTLLWTSSNPVKASEQNTTTLTELKAGIYVLTKTHTATNCSLTQEFEIKDVPPVIIPEILKKSVTRCVEPFDGELSATVNGTTEGYTFSWKELSSGKTYAESFIDKLPAGDYELTVVQTATSCPVKMVVTLDFEQVPIDVVLNEDSPLTNCDPAFPNAEVSAIVGGRIVGYDFKWYKGTTVDENMWVANGSTCSKMKAEPYTLWVRDIVTECTKTVTYTPTVKYPIVPAPKVDTIRGVTSCVSPNGFAEMSVEGNTSKYIFKWYKAIGEDMVFEGYSQNQLDNISYYVVAKDRLTGCESEPTKVDVMDERVFVKINVATTNSICHNNDGSAQISWIEPVPVSDIRMTNGITEYNNDVNYGLPYGQFKVTVVTMEGCESTTDVTIGADYLVYNGISPNDDGENDFLIIDCIQLFPNNTVKIFNRAGALVYVGEGYDNEKVYFKGFGNKGIYTTGNYLPDGTYYYIVDKGDGSKPKAGFFELLR